MAGPTIRVLHGEPDDAELAAVALALVTALAASGTAAAASRRRRQPVMPPFQQAASWTGHVRP